jgi:hypothetical protein
VTGNLTVTANTTISGYTTSAGDLEAGNISASYDNKEVGVGGNWIHFALDLGDIAYKPASTIELFPGLNISVAGNANVTLLPSGVTFTGYSPNTTWTWAQDLYDNGAFDQSNLTTQMQLSDQGVLTLESTYFNTPSNITFDPGNQTIVFSNGLTIQKASGYLLLGLGSSGFAVGTNVTANSTGGFALGNNATANATGAFALGTNVTANALNSITVGHYSSSIAGNATTWQSKDPAFIVGIGNSSTPANGLVVLNNGIIYSGAGNGTDATTGIPTGIGTYMAWDPIHGDFIAASIVNGSLFGYGGQVAIGSGHKNIGIGSVTIGGGDEADSSSVAIGYVNWATNPSSIAIGKLEGSYSQGGVALGYDSYVNGGWGGVVEGYNGSATGNGVVVMGYNDIGSGSGAISLGNATSATGNGTIAIGNNVTVTGVGSAALGSNLTVSANYALVAGQYALNVNSTSNIVFAIGNGNSSTHSNAFTVLSNGNTTITGDASVSGNSTLSGANTTISGNATIGGNTTNTTLNGNITIAQPQGDIPMGQFGD